MKTILAQSITAEVGRAYSAYLRQFVKAAAPLASPRLRELSIVLVSDETMSALHQQYMNESGPTDVLTFPLELDRRGMAVAGEIVVCVPEARRRGKLEGTLVKNELLLYAIHGLLHLAGHDDRTEKGFRKMHAMEDKILTKLGIGPVFSRPARKETRSGHNAVARTRRQP